MKSTSIDAAAKGTGASTSMDASVQADGSDTAQHAPPMCGQVAVDQLQITVVLPPGFDCTQVSVTCNGWNRLAKSAACVFTPTPLNGTLTCVVAGYGASVTLDAVTLETHPVCRSQPKTITRSVTLTPVCDALDAGDDDAGSSNCRR